MHEDEGMGLLVGATLLALLIVLWFGVVFLVRWLLHLADVDLVRLAAGGVLLGGSALIFLACSRLDLLNTPPAHRPVDVRRFRPTVDDALPSSRPVAGGRASRLS